MSDSEGTKELSGIARSIDALFSSTPADSVDTLEGTPEAGERGVSALDGLPPDPTPNEAAVEAWSGPLESGTEGLDDGLVLDEEFAGSQGFEAGPPDEAYDHDALPEASDHDALAEASHHDALAEAYDHDALAEAPVEAAQGSEPVAIGDIAPTPPLEAAVEAFLAGDSDRRAEIERLALEMRDGPEVDAVAAAVGRLAAAAGEPPDNDLLEVALVMATPLVYQRLARQMGAVRDEERREGFFVACRNLGEPMAMAVRDDLAESTDRLARRVHCEALVEMGPVGRPIIEEMAESENRFLVRNAVAILGETGGEGAVELVTIALANPDAKVRREALRSLAKLGDEEAGELVIGLLEDSDMGVRIAAAVTAGELHVERALRSLIKMLDDTSDPDEAIPIIRALGQLGDPGAVTSIEKHAVPRLFSKPRTDVRIAGYRALNQIGTPHARRLLNQALDDKDAEVKAAVKEILGMR